MTGSPGLVYGLSVPGEYRSSIPGWSNLWLPMPESWETMPSWPGRVRSPSFSSLTPLFYPGRQYRSASGSSGEGRLFTYTFSEDEYKSPAALDFFLWFPEWPELAVGRLDIQSGAAVPENWYRLVKPFTFDIRDIILQRGGVTVLNNVINHATGETAHIRYHLLSGGQVTVQVFTLDGTLVDVLYRGRQESGIYQAVWDGTNRSGRPVARGMYFVRVVAPDIDEIRKIMVVK